MASVNSVAVLNFLKAHFGSEFSKQQLAQELNISLSSVIGSINGLTKKGYVVETRADEIVEEPATETRKAKVRVIKYHTLTEAGLAYDPEEEDRQKAAEKEAKKAAKAAEKASK